MPGKRKVHLSEDEYYMGIAMLSGMRSKDPKTQVGACIVNDGRIVSYGYNGAPPGWDDDDFPWDSVGEITGDVTQTKDNFVIHAEENAVIIAKVI